MQRREFLAGAAALPLFGMPFRGVLRRDRFSLALEQVINQKARERKVIIPVGAIQERVEYQGKVAAVVDHVFTGVETELPWWRATLKMIVEWIIENWDTIVAVLVRIAPLFLLLL
jgi:hypothetical protein